MSKNIDPNERDRGIELLEEVRDGAMVLAKVFGFTDTEYREKVNKVVDGAIADLGSTPAREGAEEPEKSERDLEQWEREMLEGLGIDIEDDGCECEEGVCMDCHLRETDAAFERGIGYACERLEIQSELRDMPEYVRFGYQLALEDLRSVVEEAEGAE